MLISRASVRALSLLFAAQISGIPGDVEIVQLGDGLHGGAARHECHDVRPLALLLETDWRGLAGLASCAVAVFAFVPLCQLQARHVLVGAFTKGLPVRYRAMFDLVANLLFLVLIAVLALQLGRGTQEKFSNHDTHHGVENSRGMGLHRGAHLRLAAGRGGNALPKISSSRPSLGTNMRAPRQGWGLRGSLTPRQALWRVLSQPGRLEELEGNGGFQPRLARSRAGHAL